ncbi:Gfo/Idh/MocA family protein [Rhodococcus sp. NPDC127530]|uniref:Gfo/Idh/MocA family protein n=1 Tax=unclassified Rhodococcus (in: high G+C Gram-positive bacteria) TaxID=192944 RepID=UPI003643B8A8
MTPLRVGVVGAGNIASIAQLPTLVQRDDVELRALVSRREDPSALQRRWGFSRVHRTVGDMVSHEDLDAIFVLTPRSEHVEAVELALAAGIDVFCEKPLATATSDAIRLADLAQRHNRVLMVGFNRRFAPTYVAAREVFGETGATFCLAQKNRAGSEYRATFENAIHMVDLLRWFCGGDVVDVTATSAGTDKWEEDGSAALIRFSTGNTGVLVAARTAGAWGEKLDAHGQMKSAEVIAPDSVMITDNGVRTVRTMSPEKFGWATATETFGFAAAVHHFLDCVRDRREPLTSGREAVRTQQLLDHILASAGLPAEEQAGRTWTSNAVR